MLPQEFNALTANMTPGTPIPAVVTVRPDRSFHFQLRTPPTAALLLAAAGTKPSKNNKVRGANAPGRTPLMVGGNELKISAAALKSARPGKNDTFSATNGQDIGQGLTVMVAKNAGGDRDIGNGGGSTQVGEVSLKHVYEIARIKQSEERSKGLRLEGLVKSVVAQARTMGIGIVP